MIDLPHDLTSSDYTGAGEAKDKVLTRLNRHASHHRIILLQWRTLYAWHGYATTCWLHPWLCSWAGT